MLVSSLGSFLTNPTNRPELPRPRFSLILCRYAYMPALSYASLFVLQALAQGHRFGFDVMDATELPSGDKQGSFESGVDDADAGFIMLATPERGIKYYQEFLHGAAEDQAKVLSLHECAIVGPRPQYATVGVHIRWTVRLVLLCADSRQQTVSPCDLAQHALSDLVLNVEQARPGGGPLSVPAHHRDRPVGQAVRVAAEVSEFDQIGAGKMALGVLGRLADVHDHRRVHFGRTDHAGSGKAAT